MDRSYNYYITIEKEVKVGNNSQSSHFYCYIKGYNEKFEVPRKLYKNVTEGEKVYIIHNENGDIKGLYINMLDTDLKNR